MSILVKSRTRPAFPVKPRSAADESDGGRSELGAKMTGDEWMARWSWREQSGEGMESLIS